MDVIDEAQAAEAAIRAEALRLARRSQADGPAPDMVDGVPHCADCGCPIPPARLEAVPGAGLCTACQAMKEGGHA